uniref:Uncharacterized protein n=1 Tax=Panagrolaimus davidi TaxID=227884 RepID=A0A914QNM6_9BILA
MHMLQIDGPNIMIDGHCSFRNIVLKSANDISINSPMIVNLLELNANGKIWINHGIVIYCNKFYVNSVDRNKFVDAFFLNGKITSPNGAKTYENRFIFDIRSKYLHIDQHGALGIGNDPTKICLYVEGKIQCPLRNFGMIIAKERLKVTVQQIDSVQKTKDDTAHRGFEAYKDEKGLKTSTTALYDPNLSSLTYTVAGLLDIGIDPKSEFMECLTKNLNNVTKNNLTKDEENNLQNQCSTIKSLLETEKWHRGTIKANSIEIKVEKDCQDLAQIQGNFVKLAVKGSAACEANSKWSSGVVDMEVSGSVDIAGTAKLYAAKIIAGGKLECLPKSNVGICSVFDLNANELKNSGLWEINEKLIMHVEKNCIFTNESHLQTPLVVGHVKEVTQLSGSWLIDKLQIITKDLSSLKSAILNLSEASVTAENLFSNDGQWKIENNLDITTKVIEQSFDGCIKVGHAATVKAFSASENGWNGHFECDKLFVFSLGKLGCNAEVVSSTCEIGLMDSDTQKASFAITNKFKVNDGPLLVTGDSGLSFKELVLPDIDGKIKPQHNGLSVSGELCAKAVMASKVAVEMTPTADIFLSNENCDETMTMIDVGYLHTHPNSTIVASSKDIPQQFHVETKWVHEGTLIESSENSVFIAPCFINKGKLQRKDKTSLAKALFKIENYIYNHSHLSGTKLCFRGNGVLKNYTKIHAVDGFIDARLCDIVNDGDIGTRVMNLVYKTKGPAVLGGKVDVFDNFTVKAANSQSFFLECTSMDENSFKLPDFTFIVEAPVININSVVACDSKSESISTFVAAEKIIISKQTVFPSLIVQNTIPQQNIEFIVDTNGSIKSNKTILHSADAEIFMKLNGQSDFSLLEATDTVSNVTLSGDAHVFVNIALLDYTKLNFQTLADFTVNCITASKINFLPSHSSMDA